MVELQEKVREIEEIIEAKRGQSRHLWSTRILVNMTELSDFGYQRRIYSREESNHFEQRLTTAVHGLLRLSFSDNELALEVKSVIDEDHMATIYVRYNWL